MPAEVAALQKNDLGKFERRLARTSFQHFLDRPTPVPSNLINFIFEYIQV